MSDYLAKALSTVGWVKDNKSPYINRIGGNRNADREDRGLPVPSYPAPVRSPVSIGDLRHGGTSLLPGSYSPETGDRGVTGCAAVSVLSLLVLLLLMGARKKEET